ANEFVAQAPADGYTLLYAAAPYSTLEALYGKLGYDPRKDLQPVAMSATVPLFLVVNAQSPAQTAKELVAHGKSLPDGLTFGSPGNGSLPHLAAELFLRDAGAKGLVVQYRGDVMAYTDLLAGRLDATLTAITAALPHIESGKLRVLGVASAERSAIYPDAPTLREQGLPSVVAAGWYGFMAPAQVPPAVVGQLDEAINQALADADIKRRFLAQGMEPHPGSAADFGRFIDAEMRKWAAVIEQAGIRGTRCAGLDLCRCHRHRIWAACLQVRRHAQAWRRGQAHQAVPDSERWFGQQVAQRVRIGVHLHIARAAGRDLQVHGRAQADARAQPVRAIPFARRDGGAPDFQATRDAAPFAHVRLQHGQPGARDGILVLHQAGIVLAARQPQRLGLRQRRPAR